MEPTIRTDDFNLLIRDRFYVELSLRVKNVKQIEFNIIYINDKGISEKPKEDVEVIIKVKDTILLHKWVIIIEAIRKLEDKTSDQVIQGIKDRVFDISEIDRPNEFTMSESSWYKHSYIFFFPFYSYNGALLRLSYLIGELLREKEISEEDILLDSEVKNYPVTFSEH